MKLHLALLIAAISMTAANPALAWGDLGHEVVGLIAYRHLTPAVKTKIDHLLASDGDTLTAPDIGSRATWADKFRDSHRETAAWRFVDIEINSPELSVACSGFPPTPPGQTASQGPSQDCVANKIAEFAAELHDPATTPAGRLLALKFVLQLSRTSISHSTHPTIATGEGTALGCPHRQTAMPRTCMRFGIPLWSRHRDPARDCRKAQCEDKRDGCQAVDCGRPQGLGDGVVRGRHA